MQLRCFIPQIAVAIGLTSNKGGNVVTILMALGGMSGCHGRWGYRSPDGGIRKHVRSCSSSSSSSSSRYLRTYVRVLVLLVV